MHSRVKLPLLIGAAFSAEHVAATQCTLKQSPPPGSVCGISGYVNEAPYYYENAQPLLVSSLLECASICARRKADNSLGQINTFFDSTVHVCFEDSCPWCKAFQFNPQTGLCQTIGIAIGKLTEEVAKSPYVLYEPACFDCGSPCDQPFGAQLLDNGDFQGDLFGPWQTKEAAFVAGHHSSKAFTCSHINGDGTNPAYPHGYREKIFCELFQSFNFCPDSLFAIQFDYKMPVDGMEPKIVKLVLDRETYNPTWTQIVKLHYNAIDDHWRTIRSFYKNVPQSSTHTPLEFFFGGPRYYTNVNNLTYSIDNVSVMRIDPHQVPKPGSKSLIVNGGFESGKLAPWKVHISHLTPSGNFSIVSPGLNSEFALQVESALIVDVSIHQTVAVMPDTAYLFSFDIYNKLQGSSVLLSVQFGSDRNKTSLRAIETFSSGNYTFSTPVYALESNPEIHISLDSSPYGQPVRFLLDNFSLKEIKNPFV